MTYEMKPLPCEPTRINGMSERLIVEVTALHNHLLRNTPFTMYMHVYGHGDPVKLATALHDGFAQSKTPMAAAAPPAAPPPLDLDTAAVDQILGAKGTNNGGVLGYGIRRVGDIRLKGHPESFQIDGDRVFVNVSDARRVEVADLAKGAVVGAWATQPNHSNFPMAIDREGRRLFVVFRSPSRLVVMSLADGKVAGSFDPCGDADDIFVDAKRHRVYVTCGAGVVDVFEERAGSCQSIGQVPTALGTRTSLFVPELDRLFVAVRASGREDVAVWVFRRCHNSRTANFGMTRTPQIERVASFSWSSRAVSAMGQRERFPPPRLSVRCLWAKATITGMGGREKDAPKAAIFRTITTAQLGSKAAASCRTATAGNAGRQSFPCTASVVAVV